MVPYLRPVPCRAQAGAYAGGHGGARELSHWSGPLGIANRISARYTVRVYYLTSTPAEPPVWACAGRPFDPLPTYLSVLAQPAPPAHGLAVPLVPCPERLLVQIAPADIEFPLLGQHYHVPVGQFPVRRVGDRAVSEVLSGRLRYAYAAGQQQQEEQAGQPTPG